MNAVVLYELRTVDQDLFGYVVYRLSLYAKRQIQSKNITLGQEIQSFMYNCIKRSFTLGILRYTCAEESLST